MRRLQRSAKSLPEEGTSKSALTIQEGPSGSYINSLSTSNASKNTSPRHLFGFETRITLQAYAFLFPSLVGLLAFLLLPVIAVAVLSLFDWGLISNPHFIGLQNYSKLLQSPVVHQSLLVTV